MTGMSVTQGRSCSHARYGSYKQSFSHQARSLSLSKIKAVCDVNTLRPEDIPVLENLVTALPLTVTTLTLETPSKNAKKKYF